MLRTSKTKGSEFEEQQHICHYDVPFSQYLREAEMGNVKAQNIIGWLYKYGYSGFHKNYAEAARWYERSAAQNDAKGQYNLGLMYEEGLGVLKDYATAVEYYKKAAAQGHLEAIFRLGVIYEQGLLGYPKNYGIAVAYYKKAIEEEHPQALYRLGLIYEQGGDGVKQNFTLAVLYYQKAAKLEESQAQYCLGTMYEHGLGVDKNNRLAINWYKKSAEQNNLDAKNRLKMPILIHEFTCSRYFNGRNQLSGKSIDSIPEKENYLSATIVIKYEGRINIGNRIIISKEINNPYNDIYTQVMTAANDNRMFSCLDCLFTPLYKYHYFSIKQYQEKIDLISIRCAQFWQQQEQELLQQADLIIDQIIERQCKHILYGQSADLLCTSYDTTDKDNTSCYSADGVVSAILNAPRCNC